MEKYVWEFTNKRKLTKSEFLRYLERKVFRTIRKYGMFSGGKVFVSSSDDLRAVVLQEILKKKFDVVEGRKVVFSFKNLSEIAEEVLESVIGGKIFVPQVFDGKVGYPLYFVSDKEIELYASLKGLKGKKRKINEKVRSLMDRFIEKNPDLELNIVKALRV